MRILLVKTSSLGDIIHNLPVVSDLRRAFPEAQIDWCVEEAFADIPRLHPQVSEVLTVAVRRWRKALSSGATWREIGAFRRLLAERRYDAVLDTQGLFKSGLIARLANGHRYGYAAEVAREPMAARFYDETFVIPPSAHAVERNRWLGAAAFGYPVDWPLDYGIAAPDYRPEGLPDAPTAILLTASSRDDKLWPEAHWIEVALNLSQRGLTPVLPSGNMRERERAERIVAAVPGAIAAPPLGLTDLTTLIGRSRLSIGVDTGLAHLSVALGIPTLALYVTTDPARTGLYGTGFLRNLGGPTGAPEPREVLTIVEQALR